MPHPTPQHERITIRPVDPTIVAHLESELKVPRTVATILAGRGLTTYDECKRYFRPETGHLHDPFLFTGMERAVERILAAGRAREKIVVYGDYDVDGVTATAMLVRFLRGMGATCDYYLPNRLVEGYGLSDQGIDELAARGAKLVITVDCGVTACAEVARARSLGIDVIVTDHHEPKETLPDAIAVIDPKTRDNTYPDRNLAGVGVALKLCQAIALRAGHGEDPWSRYLDLAALGTAADIVPLRGENRVIASLGYAQMSNTANVGLRALVSARGLAGKRLATSQIVFMIAPCINATGRLGDSRGVDLLLTDDPSLAATYAQELVASNEERKLIDAQVQLEAIAWAGEHCDLDNDFSIVAGQPHWHRGVIGIVASRVIEKFHRPTILFSLGDDGLAKGSGRSIPGFHLLDALDKCKDLLEAYGGHAAAAGMTIRTDRLDAFRSRFNEVARSMLTPEDLIPAVKADVKVGFDDLTQKLVNIVKQMEPFGPGNMRPVLYCEGLSHRYQPRTVGGSHLKMTLTDGSKDMDAIGFGLGARLDEVRASKALRIAFSLEENEYNGRTSLQMKIKGVAA